MIKPRRRCASNLSSARSAWGNLDRASVASLKELTQGYSLSVAAGDLLILDGKWYVTHAGLLRLAQRRRCLGITTSLQRHFSDSATNRRVFKATVYRSPGSRGFVGYGDADPSNVSSLLSEAEIRLAEASPIDHQEFGTPTQER